MHPLHRTTSHIIIFMHELNHFFALSLPPPLGRVDRRMKSGKCWFGWCKNIFHAKENKLRFEIYWNCHCIRLCFYASIPFTELFDHTIAPPDFMMWYGCHTWCVIRTVNDRIANWSMRICLCHLLTNHFIHMASYFGELPSSPRWLSHLNLIRRVSHTLIQIHFVFSSAMDHLYVRANQWNVCDICVQVWIYSWNVRIFHHLCNLLEQLPTACAELCQILTENTNWLSNAIQHAAEMHSIIGKHFDINTALDTYFILIILIDDTPQIIKFHVKLISKGCWALLTWHGINLWCSYRQWHPNVIHANNNESNVN